MSDRKWKLSEIESIEDYIDNLYQNTGLKAETRSDVLGRCNDIRQQLKQASGEQQPKEADICHNITDSCSEQYHILCVNMGCGKCDKCGAKLSESLLNCR